MPTYAEMRQLLDHVQAHGQGARGSGFAAFLTTLYYTGYRPSQLLRATMDDDLDLSPAAATALPEMLDGWGRLTLRTLHKTSVDARGDITGVGWLPPEAVQVIQAYLDGVQPPEGGPLWLHRSRRPMTTAYVGYALRRAAHEAFPEAVHLHDLTPMDIRRSHIRRRLELGESLDSVALGTGSTLEAVLRCAPPPDAPNIARLLEADARPRTHSLRVGFVTSTFEDSADVT